jgi:hypothetical protein
VIDVRVAGDEIDTLLRTEIGDAMQGFRGEPNQEIATASTQDERVKAYWCLYCGAGTPINDRMVPSIYVSTLDFQITVAAGTDDRCLWGIGLVRDALTGAEIASGLISEVEGDLGALRLDRGVTPPRQFLPMTFRLEP